MADHEIDDLEAQRKEVSEALDSKVEKFEENLTQAKAKEILRDDEVAGVPLTEPQKDLFGALAGGEKLRK